MNTPHGRSGGICLHFLPYGEKIKVRPGPARAGDSPPDCRVERFKSLRPMRIQPPAEAGGWILVGVAGLEPAASWSRTKRDTKLRHTP